MLPLYSFRQLHDPNGKIPCSRFIIERVGTDHLVVWKQTVAFCVAGAGIQRPLVLSDLSSNPEYECSAGKQSVRFPGTEPIGTVYSFTAFGAVARSATLARLTGRCATPQFVPDRGGRTAQLSGNGSVGPSSPLQGLHSAAVVSLKRMPPLDKCCVVTTFYHAGISLWIFLLCVQLHFTINLFLTAYFPAHGIQDMKKAAGHRTMDDLRLSFWGGATYSPLAENESGIPYVRRCSAASYR